ncbi:tetratricopeptide repeat protein [Amycolatopsis ruanii]|uniref:tetratricopeptide repeat protein n=1 Tax=Amycolatopsis ruanii TaxID=944491 RepID=UPI0013BE9ADA|nr:tetratricopeptide repeat protein [Amycolatopsis ruanii]
MSEHANSVSGGVEGAVVQAGSVHGNVYISQPAPIPVVPRQLSPPPAGFVGRDAEVARLDELLADGGVVVLKGPGGVGKTALALSWLARACKRFPDGQLHAELALPTGEPVAPEDVLGQFLRALRVPAPQVPAGLAERTALYRSVTTGKSLAVLLDDAVSAAQVRVLLPVSGVTVVTTRRALLGLLATGAHVVPVGPLPAEPALTLLEARIGTERLAAEEEAARDLVGFCGGLPIALCVVAARAATRPRRPLIRLVAELADERARLDRLSAEGDLSVRSTLDGAYDDLPADLRRLYRALSLHPGDGFGPEVVAAMLAVGVDTAQDGLDALVDASLAEELEEGSYRLHDLVRVHAHGLALAEDSEDERAGLVHRIARWYVYATHRANRMVMPARAIISSEPEPAEFAWPRCLTQHSSALDWLEAHRTTLLALAKEALGRSWPRLALELADALQPLLKLHKHRADAFASNEIALRAAETAGDPALRDRMRKRLARAHLARGEWQIAQEHAADLLQASRARGDRRGEAGALKTLGLVAVERGDLDDAATSFRATAEILRSLGRSRGEALALINLSEALVGLGRHEAAIEEAGRARRLLSTLGRADPYNVARAVAVLGHAHLAAGDLTQARPLLEHALTAFAELGSDHERARAHQLLAQLARRVGDDDQARRHEDLARTLLATRAW